MSYNRLVIVGIDMQKNNARCSTMRKTRCAIGSYHIDIALA